MISQIQLDNEMTKIVVVLGLLRFQKWKNEKGTHENYLSSGLDS
jgi:hypothetical protein